MIFGSTNYTTSVDIWSIGCVFVEMMLARPLFPGSSSIDQLTQIIKILGDPTGVEMEEIGTPSFKDFKPTNTPPMDWNNVINKELPADLIDLLEKIFVYISFFEQYLSS